MHRTSRRKKNEIKRWVLGASDRFLWMTLPEMRTSKADYDEFALPEGL